jgi:hypothetical protein
VDKSPGRLNREAFIELTKEFVVLKGEGMGAKIREGVRFPGHKNGGKGQYINMRELGSPPKEVCSGAGRGGRAPFAPADSGDVIRAQP